MVEVPKYARLENERRFLVRHAPDLAGLGYRLIEDLYLEGRLRLRRITSSATGAVEHKLCKKYGGDDPVSAPITNLYLSAEEYAALAGLPGRAVRKRRYSVDDVSLDVFEGQLAGLMLCEAEDATRDAAVARVFPGWVDREVTADSRFTGGVLAGLTAADVRTLLAE